MDRPLLPLTRLILAVSAVVQTVFALLNLFAPGLVDALIWPAPFEHIPALWLRFDGVVYIAMGLGALYALTQNSWIAARAFLVIGASYVAMCIVLAVIAIATPPGAPLIMWVYLVLALIYLPLVALTWTRQSAPGQAAMSVR